MEKIEYAIKLRKDSEYHRKIREERLHGIFEMSLFTPEIDRLKFAGATDESITEAFKEICNPKSPYSYEKSRSFKLFPGRMMGELEERNYNICMDYLTNPNKPRYNAFEQKYYLVGQTIKNILYDFTSKLGAIFLYDENKITKGRNRARNSCFKKALHDRILEKILEENNEERKWKEGIF